MEVETSAGSWIEDLVLGLSRGFDPCYPKIGLHIRTAGFERELSLSESFQWLSRACITFTYT